MALRLFVYVLHFFRVPLLDFALRLRDLTAGLGPTVLQITALLGLRL